MNTEIYYFSGTGNSLHIARELHERLPGSKLIPIVSLLKQDIIEVKAEVIGLVFPIYFMLAPRPVQDFLQTIGKKGEETGCFFYSEYAG